MKKRRQINFALIGAFFASIMLFSGALFAQTLLSDQSDLKPAELDLDQELETAMQTEPAVSAPAQDVSSEVASEPKLTIVKEKVVPKPNLFAKTFFAAPSKKSESIATDVQGFTIVQTPSRKMDAEFAVITDFGGEVVKTRYLTGLKTIDDVNDYIQDNLETSDEDGVEIRKMALPTGGATLYWVGDKAFSNVEDAKNLIAKTRQQAVEIGGNFDEMVAEAQVPIEIEDEYVTQFDRSYISNQKKEEDLVLKWADQMDLGEQLWGSLHGEPAGEPITWQSFGETSWRKTNLEDNKFNSQVGYWANRIVFRGIRFPLNTLDPFVESVISMEAVSEDFKSKADFFVGVEWRPLARNHWLANYRPFGNINLLEWVRNYRFYVAYGDRKNIKDEISAQDHDLRAGVQLFYEFGVELPDLNQPAPESFTEYLQEFVWGEYFADYRWAKTDFGTIKDSHAFTLGNSLMLGIKLPGIPLPANPINDEIVLMPYFRFENTLNNTYDFHFQNRYFLSVGMRWMPFRTWRHKENEWLSKVKVFGEWLAIGKVQHTNQDATETGSFVRNDLRFGVSFASRRY